MPNGRVMAKPEYLRLPHNKIIASFTFDEMKEMYLRLAGYDYKFVFRRDNRDTLDWLNKNGRLNLHPPYYIKVNGIGINQPAIHGFFGATQEQMVDWLHNGFRSRGLSIDPPIEQVRKRRRLSFGEDGEFQYDLAMSGFDYPFVEWSRRDISMSIKLEIFVGFTIKMKYNIISQYFSFVLKTIAALEEAGIDLQIDIVTEMNAVFDGQEDVFQLNINLKKENEQSDYLSWSPIFSPGGYRHLIFTSLVKACDLYGQVISANFGKPINLHAPWSVCYNPETHALRFMCPALASDFPEKDMQDQLMKILSQSKQSI